MGEPEDQQWDRLKTNNGIMPILTFVFVDGHLTINKIYQELHGKL
jgi:hypothetical protein